MLFKFDPGIDYLTLSAGKDTIFPETFMHFYLLFTTI